MAPCLRNDKVELGGTRLSIRWIKSVSFSIENAEKPNRFGKTLPDIPIVRQAKAEYAELQ